MKVSATATVGTGRAIAARTASGKIGALAGFAFAFLFLMGTAMLNIPLGASDQKLVAWWSDSGNQLTSVISMYSFVLAGLCFLVFLVHLRSRLLAAEGGTGTLTTLVVAAGVVFVAMLFVAASSRGAIGFAMKGPANNESLPGPDTLRYMPQTGYAALGAGGLLAAAVAMATMSLLIVRTAVFGRWLAWLGVAGALVIVVANVALSGMAVIPAVLIWALATSVVLWRAAR
jgi:hypothetical protein